MPKSDLLRDEIDTLQRDYRELLLRASEGIFRENSAAIIDEIKTFWYTNRRLVDCILTYVSRPFEAYVFTGATYLDVAEKEHYPFVALGMHHFVDDPICQFSEIATRDVSDRLASETKELVSRMIKNNVAIVEEYSQTITILPIRYLTPSSTELAHKAGMKAFLSLFRVPMDFEQYKGRFRTVEDIEAELEPGVEKVLIFTEDDDPALPLKDRLEKYKAEVPFEADAPDAYVFWASLYGYFTQAFDIIAMCAQYQLVPYVRHSVTAQYILSLSGNFKDCAEIQDMVLRSAIAHVLYRSFDRARFEKVSFEDYKRALMESSFSDNVLGEIRSAGLTLTDFSVPKAVSIIKRNLDVALDQIT